MTGPSEIGESLGVLRIELFEGNQHSASPVILGQRHQVGGKGGELRHREVLSLHAAHRLPAVDIDQFRS